jgi:uncharacterized protein (TIGR02217 family)
MSWCWLWAASSAIAVGQTLDDLQLVIAFFEERRGRLYGFRWRDHADHKSCLPSATPTALDQTIGVGTGALATFQIAKTYGSAHAPYVRTIERPVAGSVVVAVAGVVKAPSAYAVDSATGIVTFAPGQIPAAGTPVTAGFLFDVPVRFDTDKLEIDLSGFHHGTIPGIPIVEIRA